MKKDKLWSLLRDIYGYFEMFVFAGCAVVACQSPSPYSDGLVLALTFSPKALRLMLLC